MPGPLIECVPNFSEGRDAAVLETILRAIRSAHGVSLLASEMDPDHNRSVVTFAGPPEAVAEGALRGIAAAVECIDLRRHTGVHPRIGAADVVPFVPLRDATLPECAAIARETGQKVWERLHVPVYFYEAAAAVPERAPLENCRRGGFEHPALAPDLGGPQLHPSAGACCIGARKLLVAFNVNLNTTDLEAAQSIARKIRASSGGLPCVKAMGVALATRNLVQVSMNLTDMQRTPLSQVFEAVRNEAAAREIPLAGTQIVGMLPRQAFDDAATHGLPLDPARILEDHLP